MSDENDLSQGEVLDSQGATINSEISEDAQRRRWKTGILWISSFLVLVFYSVLIYLVLCHPDTSHWTLGILAAIPTLLATKLIQLVSPPKRGDDNLSDSPWFGLARELIQAIKDK